jgi:hypothetical protein
MVLNQTLKDIWKIHYEIMKRCNDVIRNLPKITIEEGTKQVLLGEAHFNHVRI